MLLVPPERVMSASDSECLVLEFNWSNITEDFSKSDEAMEKKQGAPEIDAGVRGKRREEKVRMEKNNQEEIETL